MYSRAAGEKTDKAFGLSALLVGADGELHAHAAGGMHNPYDALGPEFHVFGAQDEDHLSAFWKRRSGFDVAGA